MTAKTRKIKKKYLGKRKHRDLKMKIFSTFSAVEQEI